MPGRGENTAQGALGGAATGAVVGSVVPGVGTAIGAGAGALIGGAMGYFGSGGRDAGMTDDQRKMYEQYVQYTMGRQAPQVQNSGLRNNQVSLISALEAQSQGKGPSMAEEQLKSATDRNVRTQQQFANTARGSGASLAAFQAQNNSAQLGAQAAQDSAAARIAEVNAARAQLGTTLHNARGSDEATSRANLEAHLRQQGLNDDAIARAMATFNNTPQVASMGDKMFAMGAGAIGSYAQMQGGK